MKMCVIIMLVALSFTLRAQTVNFSSASVQRYDTHVVSSGETLYSVSKAYHTSVEELLKLNPGIVNNNLQEGKIIKVPIVKNENGKICGESQVTSDHAIMHKVEHGETIYSIGKKFSSDVATILLWNNLKEPLIKEGQNLIVGYETISLPFIGPLPMESASAEQSDKIAAHSEILSASPQPSASNKNVIPSLDKKSPEENTKPLEMGVNEVAHDEKGIAAWTHSSYDEGNFYALHATAPQGTEITVRNLMNNKTITVKVIGRLPATSDNENVLIKLSESAAKKLNVLDERFLVEINYIAPVEISGVPN